MGHKSTHVTETVYRHVIVPEIRGGATVTDNVFNHDEDDQDEGKEEAIGSTATRRLSAPHTRKRIDRRASSCGAGSLVPRSSRRATQTANALRQCWPPPARG